MPAYLAGVTPGNIVVAYRNPATNKWWNFKATIPLWDDLPSSGLDANHLQLMPNPFQSTPSLQNYKEMQAPEGVVDTPGAVALWFWSDGSGKLTGNPTDLTDAGAISVTPAVGMIFHPVVSR